MRHDGYYLSAPTSYVDHVAGGNQRTGLIHTAFLFLDNGVVKRQTMESKSTLIFFERKDFEEGYPGEYIIKGNLLQVVFGKGQDWELRTTYEISENLITSIESNSASGIGQAYEFHEL